MYKMNSPQLSKFFIKAGKKKNTRRHQHILQAFVSQYDIIAMLPIVYIKGYHIYCWGCISRLRYIVPGLFEHYQTLLEYPHHWALTMLGLYHENIFLYADLTLACTVCQ